MTYDDVMAKRPSFLDEWLANAPAMSDLRPLIADHIMRLEALCAEQQAEIANLASAFKEAIYGITRVVWDYDPQELLTVGQYGQDLLRVVERMKAERDQLQARVAEQQTELKLCHEAFILIERSERKRLTPGMNGGGFV